jgi:uncharacterized Zn finger protein (UPF0148 family)
MMVSYCSNCGDFLFDGRHRGNVERWCRELRETISAQPEKPATSPIETISKTRRGRPRKGDSRETISAAKPWKPAGMSRATWYRQKRTLRCRPPEVQQESPRHERHQRQ